MVEPIIETEDEFNKLYYGRWFIYNCRLCGISCRSKKIRPNQCRLLCSKCARKQTNLDRYGVENAMSSPKVRQVQEQNNMKKYGCKYVIQADVVKEKITKHFQETLGVDYPFQKKEMRDKAKQSIQEKYSVDYYSQTDEYKQKYQQTSLKKYDVNHPMQSQQVKDKVKDTCLKRYGVNTPLLVDSVRNKIQQTNLDRYGDVNYINSDTCKQVCLERYGTEKPHPCRYTFDNVTFDSYWELCFYVYFQDHNLWIERVKKPYEYVYNEKVHFYFPDFKISCGIVEIKGDHFWKSDGTMCNPFDHNLDALFEAKHQCGLKNNVIFLSQNDVQFALNYVESTYGKKFKGIYKVSD